MQTEEIKQILVIEFKTEELKQGYSDIDTLGLDLTKIEVIFVVNPSLEEDEKIIQVDGWYELSYIDKFRKQLERTLIVEPNTEEDV